jgi:hypothetical protein
MLNKGSIRTGPESHCNMHLLSCKKSRRVGDLGIYPASTTGSTSSASTTSAISTTGTFNTISTTIVVSAYCWSFVV